MLSNLSLLSIESTVFSKLQLPTLLITAFKYRDINTNKFPLIIGAQHIRHSNAYYKRYVKSCVAVMSKVCCYCRLFICLLSLTVILRYNPLIAVALGKDAINMAFLDHNG